MPQHLACGNQIELRIVGNITGLCVFGQGRIEINDPFLSKLPQGSAGMAATAGTRSNPPNLGKLGSAFHS